MTFLEQSLLLHAQIILFWIQNTVYCCHHMARDVIDSRQIDKSTFSICQLNRIEWLGIESNNRYSVPQKWRIIINKQYTFPVKLTPSETLTKY